jgi:hypothetical protein
MANRNRELFAIRSEPFNGCFLKLGSVKEQVEPLLG